jgi:hypothetical protein
MIEHVVGGHDRRAGVAAQLVQARQALEVLGGVGAAGRQPRAAAQVAGHADQVALEAFVQRGRRDDQAQLPIRVVQEILPRQMALPLFRPPLTDGQQAGQPGEGLAVGRVAEQAGRAVHEVQTAARQDADVALLGRRPGAHDPGQGVAVGDADGGQAQGLGGEGQLLRVGGAAQEREVGGGWSSA